MSRGPGVWQRRILAAVNQHGTFYLRDLLGPHATPAAVVAATRAAHRLAAARRLVLTYYRFGSARLLVRRPELPKPPTRPPRLSVHEVPDENLPNTYQLSVNELADGKVPHTYRRDE